LHIECESCIVSNCGYLSMSTASELRMVKKPTQKSASVFHCPWRAALWVTATLLSSPLQATQVINNIDGLTTAQTLSAENTSVTDTIASGTAIGGFRTVTLTSTNNDPDSPTRLAINSTNNTRLSLATPEGASSTFTILWGGSGGTNGLGGVNFGAGQPIDLFTSFVAFPLRSSDQASNFTWSFTDTNNTTASYTGTFPVHASTNPFLNFNIFLSDFSNSALINWSAINFISFSGGGVPELDISIPAPLQIVASTVPEPSTWALLIAGAALTAVMLHGRTRRRP